MTKYQQGMKITKKKDSQMAQASLKILVKSCAQASFGETNMVTSSSLELILTEVRMSQRIQ